MSEALLLSGIAHTVGCLEIGPFLTSFKLSPLTHQSCRQRVVGNAIWRRNSSNLPLLPKLRTGLLATQVFCTYTHIFLNN